jgi:hypothetical protein
MSDQLMTTYMVELLYTERPQIDRERLLDELRRRCGNVERLTSHEELYLYAFPDHLAHYTDGSVPAQIFLAFPEERKEPMNLDDALQQSWGWEGAHAAAAACQTSVLLTDMMARGLDYKTRLELFHNALESVLAVAPCQAIHWAPAQHLVDPQAYLEARRSPDAHPLQHAVNVRFFHISNGQPGEMLMDTMGLATLGLPDLQCHFLELEPGEVARVLYNTAAYIYDNGDIVEDGHTIQGIRSDDRWLCRHELALVGPDREVLDVNPGMTHAAGSRE